MDALWGVPSSLVIGTRRTVELHDFLRAVTGHPLPSRGGLSLGTVKVQPGPAHDAPEDCDRGFTVVKT